MSRHTAFTREYPGRAGSWLWDSSEWLNRELRFSASSCKLCPPNFNEPKKKWMGMATDYDAPRKSDDDSESIEALKERVPDKMSGVVDVDDADNPGSFELAGQDLSDLDLDVVVLPPQADEFTCVSCFLVKHRSQIDHEEKLGPICLECAA